MGLTFEKLLIIGIIAVFLIGPDRLPRYAAKFAQFIRSIRGFADGAKDRMKDEMGDDFNDVDWRKLDPRQYDPRRIIRDALMDEPAPSRQPGRKPVSAVMPPARPSAGAIGAAGAAGGGAAIVRESAGTSGAGPVGPAGAESRPATSVDGELATVAPTPYDSEAT